MREAGRLPLEDAVALVAPYARLDDDKSDEPRLGGSRGSSMSGG